MDVVKKKIEELKNLCREGIILKNEYFVHKASHISLISKLEKKQRSDVYLFERLASLDFIRAQLRASLADAPQIITALS